jgi:hypothetical protein
MSSENNINLNENINKMRELTDSIVSDEALKKLDDNGYSMKLTKHKDFGVYSNVDGKEILTYAIQNDSIYGEAFLGQFDNNIDTVIPAMDKVRSLELDSKYSDNMNWMMDLDGSINITLKDEDKTGFERTIQLITNGNDLKKSPVKMRLTNEWVCVQDIDRMLFDGFESDNMKDNILENQIDDYHDSIKRFTYDKDFEVYDVNFLETFEITEDVEDSNKFNEYLDKTITKCDEKSDIMESVNRLTKDNNFHSDYFVANELKELGLIDDKLHEEITDYRFKEDMIQLCNPENQRKQYEAYMNILGRKKEVGYINLPRVINDFKENNIKAVYNEENDNYDIISTRPNYKGEEYKILSCDKNGIVETNTYDMDLDLMSDYSNFYGYVQNLQALKAVELYKDFDINCYDGYCDKMEIDLNNKDFNRKLVIENDVWNGMEDVQNKFVLEYPSDKEINLFNGIGSLYEKELLGRENGKLGEYMQFKDHDHITKTDYDVYFLKDKTDYQNVTKYIDDLVEDMDKISELKNKQDFINAVSSVTNKEQDKGMEL